MINIPNSGIVYVEDLDFSAEKVKLVKEAKIDSLTCAWIVEICGEESSDTRIHQVFADYDEDGHIAKKEFERSRLPEAVQQFLGSHKRRVCARNNRFAGYVWK